jgi:hypothetical protein
VWGRSYLVGLSWQNDGDVKKFPIIFPKDYYLQQFLLEDGPF